GLGVEERSLARLENNTQRHRDLVLREPRPLVPVDPAERRRGGGRDPRERFDDGARGRGAIEEEREIARGRGQVRARPRDDGRGKVRTERREVDLAEERRRRKGERARERRMERAAPRDRDPRGIAPDDAPAGMQRVKYCPLAAPRGAPRGKRQDVLD